MSEVERINADELFTALRQIDDDEFIRRLLALCFFAVIGAEWFARLLLQIGR